MPYNSQISRSDAESLIPEEVVEQIIQEAPAESAVMQLATKLPNMSRNQQRMSVLSSLPMAYFKTGETALAQTTNVSWANKFITAEELTVIVPIAKNVLDDPDYDIWAETRPLIAQAFGKAVDAAVLYGTNAPSSWPTNILTAATNASHVVDLSTRVGAGDDIYDVIMGETGVLALIEADGFGATGHIGALTMKAKLRGLRDDGGNGLPIFVRSMQEAGRYELDGESILFPKNGAINPATSLLISGDWSKLVYSVRKDVSFTVLDQAVIQDASGNIIYNLAQQGMVALMCDFRLGWQLPNPVNAVNEVEATRYPFAVLVP